MKYFFVLAFLLAAQTAAADNFLARATAARAASSTPQGTKYDQSLWPMLTAAGSVCDPPGTTLPASELGQFDLIAFVTPAGRLIDVEVKPDTPVAECFAAQLEKNQLAAPPLGFRSDYPILVDLTVTQ